MEKPLLPRKASEFKGLKQDFKFFKTLLMDSTWNYVRRVSRKIRLQKEMASGLYEAPFPPKQNTLSVCIMSMNAADRITPLVSHALTFADEVVIGIDSKTTDETLEVAKAAGAHKVFVIQNDALTCNGALEELTKACTSDWVLRLDDDEYMEPEFLSIKDKLINQTKITHYKFPRLHLSHIKPLQWINDGYLYPDYQVRLFKNDLRLLSFPKAVGHASIGCKGQRGKIHKVNIIHLNMAINSRQKREAKLEKYIQRLNGGWVHPINVYALLFEDYHYRIEPYNHPDRDFCEMLERVVIQANTPLSHLEKV